MLAVRYAVAFLSLVVCIAVARADGKAAAELAFDKATALANAGNYREACPLFEASYKADPQLGVLLNLADCHERVGRTATAWVEFRDAIAIANKLGDQREAYAQRRADALAPRLATLHVVAPVPEIRGLSVHLDDVDVTLLLGTQMPIDPGEHTIAASAAGYVAWSTTVSIADMAKTTELSVPALAKLPDEPAAKLVAVAAAQPADIAAAVERLEAQRRERDTATMRELRRHLRAAIYLELGFGAPSIPIGSVSVLQGDALASEIGPGVTGGVGIRRGLGDDFEVQVRLSASYYDGAAFSSLNGVYCFTSNTTCGDWKDATSSLVHVALDASVRYRPSSWYVGVGPYVPLRIAHFSGTVTSKDTQASAMVTGSTTDVLVYGTFEIGREFGAADNWDLGLRLLLAPDTNTDGHLGSPTRMLRIALGYTF